VKKNISVKSNQKGGVLGVVLLLLVVLLIYSVYGRIIARFVRPPEQIKLENTISEIKSQYEDGAKNSILLSDAEKKYVLWNDSIPEKYSNVTNFSCAIDNIQSGSNLICHSDSIIYYELKTAIDYSELLAKKKKENVIYFCGALQKDERLYGKSLVFKLLAPNYNLVISKPLVEVLGAKISDNFRGAC
jgi:hypothetical protein